MAVFYKNAGVYFFSGTGNTRRVASWVAETLSAQGARALLAPIETVKPTDLPPDSPDTLIAVSSPTHGFTAPLHYLKWLLSLPRAKHSHAVCFATRAGCEVAGIHPPGVAGSAALLPALILALKGYKVRGAASFNMPSNWMTVHPALPPAMVERILAHVRPLVEAFAQAVGSGRSRWLTPNNLYEFALGLLLLPVTLLYVPLGRPSLGLSFFANPSCNACGLCEKHCPVGALRLEGEGKGRPKWSKLCESCMRCMGFCPQGAVEVGHSWLLLMTLLGLAPVAALWPTLTRLDGAGMAAAVAAYCVLSYYGMVGGYALFHRALGVGWVRRFFSATTLTRYFRRYHEPGTRVTDFSPVRGGADRGRSAGGG